MDTRLTRIRNNGKFKALLVLISCVLFFIGVFFLQKVHAVYRYDYNLFNVIGQSMSSQGSILGNGYTDFAEQVKTDSAKVAKLCTVYISDEAVESGEAYAAREAAIRASYEKEVRSAILNAKLDEIEGLYVYDDMAGCYEYPFAPIDDSLILKNFSSEDQIRADERSSTGRGLTTVNGVDYYKGYPVDEVLVNETAIRKNVEATMESEIVADRAQFRAEYENIKKYLASLVNFEYYFVNRETGMVYTNMEAESITEASKDMSYYAVSLINGDLRVSDEIATAFEIDGYVYYTDKVYMQNALYSYIGFIDSEDFDLNQFDAYIHVNTTGESLLADDVYTTLVVSYENAVSTVTRDMMVLVISVVAWILCLVLLASVAGRVDSNGKVLFTTLDKLPNSVHFVGSAFLVVGLITIALVLYFDVFHGENNDWIHTMLALIGVVANLFFVEWLMSVSRQIRGGQLFKNTIINRFVIQNYQRIRAWWESDENRLVNKTIRRKVFMPIALYILVAIPLFAHACMMIGPWGEFIGWFEVFAVVGLTVALFTYLVRLTASLDNINAALSDADQGKFDYKVNLERAPVVIRPMAEKVNNLTDGIKIAVDEAVRGERMKTELITNVSHDLKTPLTSIITYTDLLKHCDIQDEKALEYIDVLDEKSARLRRLIEDLVEASKASTGNVKLVMTKINLNEMVEQVFGEYEDALASLQLDLRYNTPEEPVFVTADGQKTYRIIENLFSNVKKYTMPGTRVYLDVTVEDRFAVVAMKNISKDEMNFDVSRLTERFVRGDESRSTEGSGLGLSIAKSLTELQDGKFDISVDGDLFKVVIKMPLSEG